MWHGGEIISKRNVSMAKIIVIIMKVSAMAMAAQWRK
jgi:hypothetical protein